MMEDDVLEKVYNMLSATPQRTAELAQKLRMDKHKLAFALSILRRTGRARRVDRHVRLGYGCGSSRTFWVKVENEGV
jgi:hypothetical protein